MSLKDKKTASKSFEIKKTIVYEDRRVNLFDVPYNIRCNTNINCEDLNGNEIWRIKDINPLEDFPFVDIIYIDNNKLKACNWKGWDYYIELENGYLELVYKQRY